MAILNQDNVRVQYFISKDTEIGTFNDALYFTAQEFTMLPEHKLQELVDERANAWVDSVKTASIVETVVAKEDLQAEKAELEARIDEIETKIVDAPLKADIVEAVAEVVTSEEIVTE